MGGRSGQGTGRGGGGGGIITSNLTTYEKNYINSYENSNNPLGFNELSELYENDKILYSIERKISTNFNAESNVFSNEEMKKFSKIKTIKNYELYRGDGRYSTNNVKKGDTLDFSSKPTFVSSDINQGIVNRYKNTGIIVFEKGVKSLRRKFDTAEKSELISGNYKVTKIVGNKIYVKN
jgi:hypothetical protein